MLDFGETLENLKNLDHIDIRVGNKRFKVSVVLAPSMELRSRK